MQEFAVRAQQKMVRPPCDVIADDQMRRVGRRATVLRGNGGLPITGKVEGLRD